MIMYDNDTQKQPLSSQKKKISKHKDAIYTGGQKKFGFENYKFLENKNSTSSQV